MTAAAVVLARALAAGVAVRVDGAELVLRGRPGPELIAVIREVKPALVALLHGNVCRHCGEPLPWPAPAGVVLADGTAECMRCADDAGREWWSAGHE